MAPENPSPADPGAASPGLPEPAALELFWREPKKQQDVFEWLDPETLLREAARTVRHFAGVADPLTRFISTPRALPLGGRSCVVHELRVRDLALLDEFLLAGHPDPFDELPPAWADPDPDTYPERLHRCWVHARTNPPPRALSAAGQALLSALPGRAFTLSLCLRSGRVPKPATLLRLAADATPAQWARFHRFAWGVSSAEAIARSLGPDADGPDKPAGWNKVFEYLLTHRGMGFEQVGDLTLSQLSAACSGGKSREQSEDFAAGRSAARRYFEERGFAVP